jgi:hypothetical protein
MFATDAAKSQRRWQGGDWWDSQVDNAGAAAGVAARA